MAVSNGAHQQAGEPTPRVVVVGDGGALTQTLMERLAQRQLKVVRATAATVTDRVLASVPSLVVLVGDAAADGGEAVATALSQQPAAAAVPLAVIASASERPGLAVSRHAMVERLSISLGPDALADRTVELASQTPGAGAGAGGSGAGTANDWSQRVDAMLGNFDEVSDTGLARIANAESAPRAPADPTRLRGLSVLVIDNDSGRADIVSRNLRDQQVNVSVWDGTPATLPRLHGKDADVAVIGDDYIKAHGHTALRALHGHLRLRWASLARVHWDELMPATADKPQMRALAGHIVPLVEADRALSAQLTTHRNVETDCENLGPGRTLRALGQSASPVRVCFGGLHATVELGLSQGLLVGAWGESETVGPVEGLSAVALLLTMVTAHISAEARPNPAPPNVMLALDEALEQAVPLSPTKMSSAPPAMLHHGDRSSLLPPSSLPPSAANESEPPRRSRQSHEPGTSITATIPAPSMQPPVREPSGSPPGGSSKRPTVQAPAERLLAALDLSRPSEPLASPPASESMMDQMTQPVPPPQSLAPSKAVEQQTKLTLRNDPLPEVVQSPGLPGLPPPAKTALPPVPAAAPLDPMGEPANDTEAQPSPFEGRLPRATMNLDPEDLVEAGSDLAEEREAGRTTMNIKPAELLECVEQLDYDPLDDAPPPPAAPVMAESSHPPSEMPPEALVGGAFSSPPAAAPSPFAAPESEPPDPGRESMAEEQTGVFHSNELPLDKEPEAEPDPLDELFSGLDTSKVASLSPQDHEPVTDPAPARDEELFSLPSIEGMPPLPKNEPQDAPPPIEDGNLSAALEPSHPPPAEAEAEADSEPVSEAAPDTGERGEAATTAWKTETAQASTAPGANPWIGRAMVALGAIVLLGALGLRAPQILRKLRPPPPPPPALPAPPAAAAALPNAPAPAAEPAAPEQTTAAAPAQAAPPVKVATPAPTTAAADKPGKQPDVDDEDANEAQADQLVTEARRSARKGDVSAAKEKLQQAMELDPKSARPAAALARILMDDGEGEASIKWAREAVNRRPRRAQLHLLLGDTLMQHGKERDARAAWKRASELRPGDPRILARLARGPEKKRRRRRRRRD